MSPSLTRLLARMKDTGALAVIANLLFDAILIGWIAFAGLYSIEVLLPTFVTARISLVKLAFVLIIFTVLLSLLGTVLPLGKNISRHPRIQRILGLTVLFIAISIALAHYRFPWWAIPICLGGYAAAGYLFWKNSSSD